MSDATIVMFDSDDAARPTTVSGWVSRNNRFYGDDERTARYDGCTHRKCEECSEVVPKHRVLCSACAVAKRTARYLTFPIVEWTEGFAGIFDGDEYFADEEEAYDYCEEHGIDPPTLQLVATEPVYATEVEALDYYADDIPEDGELPEELTVAFETLNEAIKACKVPLCWQPVNKRISLPATRKAVPHA